MWSIWKARNLKLWQQVSDSTVTILERAKHLLEGWRIANRKQAPTRQENVSSIPSTSHHNGDANFKWRKSRSGRYKCNVDASFPTNTNKVGLGMCIRDLDGIMFAQKQCGLLRFVLSMLGRPWIISCDSVDT